MLWIALAFVVAMMVGFLVPKKPLKLNLNAPRPSSPPGPQSPQSPPSPPQAPTDNSK